MKWEDKTTLEQLDDYFKIINIKPRTKRVERSLERMLDYWKQTNKK